MKATTNPFPSSYYVYQHIDPYTNKVVYVGHGSGGRAWQCGSSHSPLRSKDHCEWADKLLSKGLTPDDWVEIVYKGRTKSEARELERALIRELKPIYNKDIRSKCLKLTPEIYRQSLKMREEGMSYNQIGKEVGLSTMVIHRALNKMPISLEVLLESE